MTTNNDQILINQIKHGDTNAFGQLVDRYKDLVYTLAIRMLKNREEAEEVSQDTFIKTYKSLDRFKGDSKFSTWIYRVAYNTCLDRIKKNRKHLNDVAINEVTTHQVQTIDNALDKLEAEERKEAIKHCIDKLSSEDSFLLTLYYYEDLSLDEISEIVGMTSNAIKVKLFRCRKKLATILTSHLEPEIIEYYGRERK
ncbi:RNA polymerase sigma factor [Psychroserpens sp.]|uniref:RNA polymerase sigma factor n=1 Tax=Psychroserpens sp. TaxID=2020870 RepID=UPI001B1A6DEA|nr:sigma-70 family RNA polymerase sigma factor [Psychroserpens sp.]MBO6606863.1 sigma-70 family RNA polymerase sigma factor [Psychroserpens sp.]MBO6654009.1 sigma-70 family RNA polymerase sigma factor [Psychroserpens sp.]MBO6682705.1 sigma-70 family RNA polymerase sigma factor [Psychroserpens sp.]MBO6750635.1 sigma-70 family RNA polymerase sigma factor [Psychroserpens sp.]MBO6915936.1 sigma-70 family RNA polymerase sigma factor [Psychroserpens sp.]